MSAGVNTIHVTSLKENVELKKPFGGFFLLYSTKQEKVINYVKSITDCYLHELYLYANLTSRSSGNGLIKTSIFMENAFAGL